jgi:hypothetical protein
MDSLLSIYTLPACSGSAARNACSALANAFNVLAFNQMPLLLRSILAKLKGQLEILDQKGSLDTILAPGMCGVHATNGRTCERLSTNSHATNDMYCVWVCLHC